MGTSKRRHRFVNNHKVRKRRQKTENQKQHHSQRASGEKQKGRSPGTRTARRTSTIWRKSEELKSIINSRHKSKANGRREEQSQQQATKEAATKPKTRQEDDAEHSKSTAAKTTRTKEAKDFSKSEVKQGDVTDTLQHAISIIEKETIKNLVSERKDTEHSVLMMRHTTEQIMTTVEDGHNIVDDGTTRNEKIVERSAMKWYSTGEDSSQGEWDRIAEQMMLTFAESQHPVFRSTIPFSRGVLKSKGGGKLSIHYCADPGMIETVFRTIISVNQLSIYGAVSDLCDEYRICPVRTGRLVLAEQSDPLFVPRVMKTHIPLTDDPAQPEEDPLQR